MKFANPEQRGAPDVLSRYLTDLDLRVLDDSTGRPRYVLLRSLGFASAVLNADVWVPEGFETDLASVPAIGMALIGGQPGDRAAVVHDWLVRSNWLPRAQADRVFLEGLRVCGVEEAVAGTMYQAVAAYTAWLEAHSAPAVDWEALV